MPSSNAIRRIEQAYRNFLVSIQSTIGRCRPRARQPNSRRTAHGARFALVWVDFPALAQMCGEDFGGVPSSVRTLAATSGSEWADAAAPL